MAKYLPSSLSQMTSEAASHVGAGESLTRCGEEICARDTLTTDHGTNELTPKRLGDLMSLPQAVYPHECVRGACTIHPVVCAGFRT